MIMKKILFSILFLSSVSYATGNIVMGGSGTGAIVIQGAASSGSGSSSYSVSLSSTVGFNASSLVTIYSVASVPALAVGACYQIKWTTSESNGGNEYFYIDSTQVAQMQAFGGQVSWAISDFEFCNNPGSQTAQFITFNNSGFWSSGDGWTPYFTNGNAFPVTTSVNMATTHTFAVKAQGSGTVASGFTFRIRQ